MRVINTEEMYDTSSWKESVQGMERCGHSWVTQPCGGRAITIFNFLFFFLSWWLSSLGTERDIDLLIESHKNQSTLRTEKGQQAKDTTPSEQISNDLKFFLE